MQGLGRLIIKHEFVRGGGNLTQSLSNVYSFVSGYSAKSKIRATIFQTSAVCETFWYRNITYTIF